VALRRSRTTKLVAPRERDLAEDYKHLLLRTDRRMEPDDKKLTPIIFPGLVMPRLLQIRTGQYPDVEMQLPLLNKSVAQIQERTRKGDRTALRLAQPGELDLVAAGDGLHTGILEQGEARRQLGEDVAQQPVILAQRTEEAAGALARRRTGAGRAYATDPAMLPRTTPRGFE